MRTVTDWLGEYGAGHSNPTNKLLHWMCLPPIVLAVLGFLWSLPVPEAFAGVSPWLNWAISVAIFVAAWIGQFVGHAIEGKRPSFFKDVQCLLIGPLWLVAAAYRKLSLPY